MVLRLMLEYAHREGRYFERPAGTFTPAMVRLWDDLFALCGRIGLRVLLAPWDNFWMARRWHKHPYNAVNGGPAASPASFFTDEATIQATARRLQFAARRWSGSGALAAWDLFNEIHPYWGGTPVQQAAVIGRLSEAVRDAERQAWGITRLQTVSVFGPAPDPEYEALIFKAATATATAGSATACGADVFPRTLVPAPPLRLPRHALRVGGGGQTHTAARTGPGRPAARAALRRSCPAGRRAGAPA